MNKLGIKDFIIAFVVGFAGELFNRFLNDASSAEGFITFNVIAIGVLILCGLDHD